VKGDGMEYTKEGTQWECGYVLLMEAIQCKVD
jgi:hypothetical protein